MRTDPASASAKLYSMIAERDVEARGAMIAPGNPGDRPPPGHPAAETPDPVAVREPLPFVWARDVADVDAYSGEILEEILTARGFSVWYGESNSGKTYLILALGFAMAEGEPWLGKRTVPGCVIYVAAEGAATIEQRIRAHRAVYGKTEFPFGVVKTAIDMCAGNADTNRLIELVNAKAKSIGQAPALIIIDTLSRVIAGGNENDSADMGALVRNADLLREATGAHVAFVHHTGKDIARGARGHSLLRAAVDTEVEVTSDSSTGVRSAKVTKQRDLGSIGLTLHAKLRAVELGTNQWGNPVSACVVEAIEDHPPGKRVRPGRMSDSTRVWLDVLHACIARSGQAMPATSAIPGGARAVKESDWRRAYELAYPPDSQDDPKEQKRDRESRKKAFQRAREALLARGFAGSQGGWWWLT